MGGNAANDGAAGEGDNVRDDVENFYGGTGNDQITGNGLANYIGGGDGNDSIWGSGANDQLHGGRGQDFAFGNAANDYVYLNGDSIADRYNGGAGSNYFQIDRGSPLDIVVADQNR